MSVDFRFFSWQYEYYYFFKQTSAEGVTAMTNRAALFYFRCSVSEDLYGATPNADGSPLPTPGGGLWLPLDGIDALGHAKKGFIKSEARDEISKWGCHWFTSMGSTDIYWGPDGPPVSVE